MHFIGDAAPILPNFPAPGGRNLTRVSIIQPIHELFHFVSPGVTPIHKYNRLGKSPLSKALYHLGKQQKPLAKDTMISAEKRHAFKTLYCTIIIYPYFNLVNNVDFEFTECFAWDAV
jgi:hypothetical protein